MEHRGTEASVTVKTDAPEAVLRFSGPLTLLRIAPLESYLSTRFDTCAGLRYLLDCDAVEPLDTAGAIMLLTLRDRIITSGCECEIRFSGETQQRLFELTEQRRQKAEIVEATSETFLESLGKAAVKRLHMMSSLAEFIGMTSSIAASYFFRLRSIRYREILHEIHECAIKALPVVGLITFLIGIVIAYQSSLQLKLYGANIFIVDMLGIGIFRELSPLLVAIVVAGRSGSAYAAQIGVMKITEELDAMRTMGFDPYAFLVLPRMIALMLMMPVLIFFADMMGVLGGMLISKIELGISPQFFIERFRSVIDIRHFWVGVVKGPFFALLIASIGIYRGLQVKNDTQSIGLNTTRSVVESIFAVIICDAIFSIIFTNLEF